MAAKTRRRPNRRRRRRRQMKPYNRLVSLRNPVSRQALVKLRYVDEFSLDPGVGTAAFYGFSCNSLFDPNASGVGHQPYGFDQWMTFYHRYCVIGAKITVDFFTNSSVSTTANCHVGVRVDQDLVSTLDRQLLLEKGSNRYRTLSTSTSGKSTVSVTKTFSAKKFFGVNNITDGIAYKGTDATSPSSQAYFSVYAAPIFSSQDLSSINCLATIEYIALLSEPIDLPGS